AKNQAANDGPTAEKSYFSASSKCLKVSLLFSPASVHFHLTTYINIPSDKSLSDKFIEFCAYVLITNATEDTF
ncbi:hypothetical protein, partial [Spirosoma pulveris]